MKALSLFSGGLDSILSVKLIMEQGIEIIALHFDTGFGGYKHQEKLEYLQKITSQIGVKLEIIDIKEQFVKDILFNPKYGYGKNFNPCIDCHANMFSWALKLLDKYGASFVISGEVVGQRPMSQRFDALKKVSDLAGSEDLILRPLSAKLLPPTLPEREGWVERNKLLDIQGRSRKVQMELAKEWGITQYETPAGGCLLTDPHFGKKMKDIAKFDISGFDITDIPLLKTGRHFRLPDGAKLIIGREEKENNFLLKAKTDKYLKITLLDIIGPDGLIYKTATDQEIMLAARIILTYAKHPYAEKEYKVEIENYGILSISPFNSKKETQKYLIGS